MKKLLGCALICAMLCSTVASAAYNETASQFLFDTAELHELEAKLGIECKTDEEVFLVDERDGAYTISYWKIRKS